MDETIARHARRFHAQLAGPAFPEPSLVRLIGFRMARTSIRREQGGARPDPTYYREHGWFDSEFYYPTHLGPVKRAVGALADRVAARSSRRRMVPRPEPRP